MGAPHVFSRRYRAALLDYLLSNSEDNLSRGYELGRSAIDDGVGLLEILRTHQSAVNVILESTHQVELSLRHLRATEQFLMETLSPFEMTYRGYMELVSDAEKSLRKEPERPRLTKAK